MIRRFSAIALVIVPLLAAGCVQAGGFTAGALIGSGKMVREHFTVRDFTAVEVRGGASAEIVPGDPYDVVVQVDDNAVDSLQVEVADGTLYIGLKPGNYGNVRVHATIAMPELTGVTATGGASVTFVGIPNGGKLSLRAIGGAGISGKIAGGELVVEAAGGSNVGVAGRAARLALKQSGGSTVRMGELEVGDAQVDIVGGSRATIKASGSVTGEVTGGGSLTVLGNPSSVSVKKSTGGQVTP